MDIYMSGPMHRRSFIQASLSALGVAAAQSISRAEESSSTAREIMTVLGPVSADKLGVALPHEHVTTDFLGAEKLPQPRYDRDLAVETILPHLKALKDREASILFECTPNYIGRDVALLRRLSQESGLSIATNTGYYGAVGNKFLPRHAHEESAEQLAARWLAEWNEGIDGTGVRPGFIKLGVEKGKLPPLHEKLVRAAAKVHRESGLTICIHTGDGEAALDELRILRAEGMAPEAFVWVHAQNDPGPVQWEVAGQGGWVSLDGYSLGRGNPERYVEMLLALKRRELLHRVLISHDDGWSVDGEEPTGAGLTLFGNGNPRPYENIFTRLIPDLQANGFDQSDIQKLTELNPAQAFAIRVRAS
jgi:phosphotriesterase-related protein